MRSALHNKELEAFWEFVYERHKIWERRVVEGEEAPWTRDSILRSNRFTNVYRHLDPGTQYAIQSILGDDDLSKSDKIFNTMVYRLIGREETHEKIGNQKIQEFDTGEFRKSLRAVQSEAPHSVFTGAYTVCSYHQYGGEDKVENVSILFSEIASEFDTFRSQLEETDSMQEAFGAMKSLPGFGRFLSYQVLVDLHYPPPNNGGASILSLSPNEWAAAGPGARSGLKVLAGSRSHRQPSDVELMRWLQENQEEEFRRLGLDFPYLEDETGKEVRLSLPDIQNCLCEFYKYHKVREGTGKCRRRFRPATARPRNELLSRLQDHPLLQAC